MEVKGVAKRKGCRREARVSERRGLKEAWSESASR